MGAFSSSHAVAWPSPSATDVGPVPAVRGPGLSYTVGSETEQPRSHAGLGAVVLPFLAVSVAEGLEPSDVAAALVLLAGPWWVGTAVRQRIRRAEEAVARADRLERERAAEAAAVAAEERTRIARELHDIVSYSISVVTIQTQAVRRRLGPDHVRAGP